jgi:hypothetical protein
MDGDVWMWNWLLESVPDHHLEPLYRHTWNTKEDKFPVQPKDLIAEWNTRYEEEPGRPPEGYSWARDERGKFRKNERDENGRWPFGADNADAERARAKAAENRWLTDQGLPPRWPEEECREDSL